MSNFFKKKSVIIAGLFIIAVIAAYFLFLKKDENVEYITSSVQRGILIQTVSATGSVEPMREVDLNFETTGELQKLYVAIGDHVEEGDVLVELHTEDEKLQIEKARANVNLAQAQLDLKIAGESDESIQVSLEDVSKAGASLNKAQLDLKNTQKTGEEDIKQAELDVQKSRTIYNAAEQDLKNEQSGKDTSVKHAYDSARVSLQGTLITVNSVMNEADNILGIDNSLVNDDFEDYLSIRNSQYKIDAENLYKQSGEEKNIIEEKIGDLNSLSKHLKIKSVLTDTQVFLNLLDLMLYKTNLVLNNSTTGQNLSQSSLETKKASIDNARTDVNTELSGLESDRQAIITAELNLGSGVESAQAAVDKAKDQLELSEQALQKIRINAENSIQDARAQAAIAQASLDYTEAALALKKSSPRAIDLASLRAKVDEALADLKLAEQKLVKKQILAPFSGVITNINFEIGEQTNLTEPAISLLNTDDLQVEVDISEADINKIKKDDPVSITFDAFSEDDVFTGKVSFVEPAETIIQDVVYYKVHILLDKTEQDIKPGMTANIDILTEKLDNVLFMPQRAVIRKNGSKIARVLVDDKIQEFPITTGLRGDDGLVEVVSGLKENEEVVTYIREKE